MSRMSIAIFVASDTNSIKWSWPESLKALAHNTVIAHITVDLSGFCNLVYVSLRPYDSSS